MDEENPGQPNRLRDTITEFVRYLWVLTLEMGTCYRDAKPGQWCKGYGQRSYAVGH